MNRREALQLLAGTAASQLYPRRLFALMREARVALGDQPAPRTLNAHQYATVKALTEAIIPKTDTPGANDVGVSDFVDLILTEWYTDAERDIFTKGLAAVNARSQELFGKEFVGCSRDQQSEILRELGESMETEANQLRDRVRHDTGEAPEPGENFYYMLRGLTLTGYYTSEAGATAELHYEVIPDHYDGCATLPGGTEKR